MLPPLGEILLGECCVESYTEAGLRCRTLRRDRDIAGAGVHDSNLSGMPAISVARAASQARGCDPAAIIGVEPTTQRSTKKPRGNNMRCYLTQVITAFAALAFANAATAGKATEEIEDTLPFNSRSTLEVNNVNGSIEVTAWDRARFTFTPKKS
jgi:hypothetical protein